MRYLLEGARLQEWAAKIGKASVLVDAGAGSGEYSRRFLSSGFCEKVIGLEPFEPNYRLLKANTGSYGENYTAIQTSIEDIPLEADSADCVLCTQVLEHIENHGAVVDEFARILRPGGHALITVPRPPEPCEQPGHVREGYTEEELSALFEPRGFQSLGFDWFLTLTTINKHAKIKKLPLRGRFLPVRLLAGELRQSRSERQADQPYGLLGLFRRE